MRKKMCPLFGTEQKRMYHHSLSLLFLVRLANNLVRSLDGSSIECHLDDRHVKTHLSWYWIELSVMPYLDTYISLHLFLIHFVTRCKIIN